MNDSSSHFETRWAIQIAGERFLGRNGDITMIDQHSRLYATEANAKRARTALARRDSTFDLAITVPVMYRKRAREMERES